MTLLALQSGVFDTVNGLPVHILAIHGVVVGIPLMSLLTVAVASRPAWRARAGWVVAVLNVFLLGAVWVTVQSGKALAARVGTDGLIGDHIAHGQRMPWFVLGLVVAAVVAALAGRRRGLGTVALVLSVVAAALSMYAVFVTGESGSSAVWTPVVQGTGG